jgi:hypothetical protein
MLVVDHSNSCFDDVDQFERQTTYVARKLASQIVRDLNYHDTSFF